MKEQSQTGIYHICQSIMLNRLRAQERPLSGLVGEICVNDLNARLLAPRGPEKNPRT